jgi:NRAMP (natural resistance-associated macrophage protein)-like metal ion transporter
MNPPPTGLEGEQISERPEIEATSPEKNGPRALLRTLGPGLVTGASDDDPSGIATYSQVGAQFGYGMLWTMLFTYPLMAAIQEISGRLGRVTGRGLAGTIRHYYPRALLYPVVALLVIANVLNLGADIAAMGSAVKLVVGGPALLYALCFAVVSLGLQIWIPYEQYSRVLKWMTLSLFAYVATVFVVRVPWLQALRHTLLPTISWNSAYLTGLLAVLGTTISPYLFFWQASCEVEEMKATHHDRPLRQAPAKAGGQLRRIHLDTFVGMAFSNIVAFFIILTVATTLHASGKTEIQSAADAAEALRPLAGNSAFLLFTLGLVGAGMLAVPVLAGSAAYAVSEMMHWRTGLDLKVSEGKRFYGVLAAATIVGLALNLIGIDPIRALFWTAVINGVVAGPLMIVMMHMASNPRVMGSLLIPPWLRRTGWVATLVMLTAAVGLFVTWGSG